MNSKATISLILLRVTLVFLFICNIFFSSTEVCAILILDEILELNNKAITNITFKLNEEQHYLGGWHQKLILKGSDGNLWLFKFTGKEGADRAGVVSSWAKLFGVNFNEVYYISLPINGEMVDGSVQRFFSSSTTLCNISPQSLSDQQIEQLQKQQVLDWLIYNFDTKCNNFIVLSNTGEIIGVDKESCFEYPDEKIDLSRKSTVYYRKYSYYNKFWQAYIRGTIKVDLKKTFELIDHIQSFNDDILTEIFLSVVMKTDNSDPDVYCLKGIYRVMDAVLLQKKNLRHDFEEFYQMLNRERGEKFRLPYKKINNNFSKNVLQNLKSDIFVKNCGLKEVTSKENKKQLNIEAVCSAKAWRMVHSEICLPDEDPNRIIEKLEAARNGITSIHEKLAISLYIATLRRINKNARTWKNLQLITKHPKAISCSEIVCYLTQKKMIQYNSNDSEDVTLDSEDHYLLGLAYIVKDQYKNARFHFDRAKELGCDIEKLIKEE
ncbi:MAG: hypothetical protein ABH952_06740 [Candidatus Omnitrophota bacterium]